MKQCFIYRHKRRRRDPHNAHGQDDIRPILGDMTLGNDKIDDVKTSKSADSDWDAYSRGFLSNANLYVLTTMPRVMKTTHPACRKKVILGLL